MAFAAPKRRAVFVMLGYQWAEDAVAVTVTIDLEEHLYLGATYEITSPSQLHLLPGEHTTLYASPEPKELWALELYPLAGEIRPKAASVRIAGGKIILELPKAVLGETWGRLLGDCCLSWRKAAAMSSSSSASLEAGLVACVRDMSLEATGAAAGIDGHKLAEVARHIVDALHKDRLAVGSSAPDLNAFSIFKSVNPSQRKQILKLALFDPRGRRCVGAMVGMAIADSLGSVFEFLPVGAPSHRVDPVTLEIVGAHNSFKLEAGQWTDDTSMGLCLADSLLCFEAYNGSDIRVRFWNWWYRGYNNAFRLDESRDHSVGLGGNIACSLEEIICPKPPPRFIKEGSQDSGNGSLMRLSPVPIFFHRDVDLAVKVGVESSLTTHTGQIAADACGFLSFVVARAIARPADCVATLAAFLDECCDAYLKRPEIEAQPTLKRLLLARELVGSTEQCWNWRDADGPYLTETLRARGKSYNGFPVSAGYFGSYSMDGLALAMHCAYHTTSTIDAIARCVNFLGDADSTGAICGQIVGAFYGALALDMRLAAAVERWDEGEIALRAALLFALGAELTDSNAAVAAGSAASATTGATNGRGAAASAVAVAAVGAAAGAAVGAIVGAAVSAGANANICTLRLPRVARASAMEEGTEADSTTSKRSKFNLEEC